MFETRKRAIFDLLLQKGTASIPELTERLGVSDMTVRRDIAIMEAQGLARRVRGGVAAVETDFQQRSFHDRQIEELPRKRAIAGFARTLLRGGESVYIDGSTTCGEMARLLGSSGRFIVVTDSLYVLQILRGKPRIELLGLGGLLQADGNTFDGALAVENARKVTVDVCFFSARGFSSEGISNENMTGTQVKQIMIQRAGRCYLLADSTKHGRTGVIRLCGWEDVDGLVSDTGLRHADREDVLKSGTELLLVDAREGVRTA